MNEVTTSQVTTKSGGSFRNSALAGAFLALLGVSCYSLFGLFGVVEAATPYVAGAAMFVALLAIFAAIIATLKKVRKTSRKQAAILDCYVATAVIGVMGYFLAACVQTFQPGGNPADFWTAGAVAAACFGMIFAAGKYGSELFAAGKASK